MTEKRFRVNELVKYNYSEIGEYIDENHTDRPLRNDEVCELLNEQHETIERLKDNCKVLDEVKCEIAEENEQLKQQIHYLKIVCRNELDDETLKQVMGSLGDME